MNRYWQLLRTLVLGRTLIVVIFALFYLTAFSLFLMLDPSKRNTIIPLMSVVPTWGVFGLATEKLVKCAQAGAELGIPGHHESLRNAQLLIIALFLGVPISAAIYWGGQPSYMLLLCVPAALGVLMSLYANRLGIAVVAIFVVARIAATSDIAMQAFRSVWFCGAAVMGSLGVLYWWMGLVQRTVQGPLAWRPSRADATHEASNATIGASFGVAEAEVDDYLLALDRAMSTVTEEVTSTGLTLRSLCAGLGMDLRVKWRAIPLGVLIWALVLIWAHSERPGDAGVSAYLAITGLTALNLLSRMNLFMLAWRRRGPEETLLVLTPRWPAELQVKALLVSAILQSQVGTWIAWLLVTLLGLGIGWINPQEAMDSVLIMVATSCAGGAVALLAWSRDRCPETSIVSIAAFLTCAIGALIVEFGAVIIAYPRALGDLLILLPLIVGAARFLRRPLQFPVQLAKG